MSKVFMKSHGRVQEIWREHKNSRVNPLTLTLSLGSWVMCSAHRLTKRNI